MKNALWIVIAAVFVANPLGAEVVRPAPEVKWVDASGRERSSKDFRGQPLVVLITPEVRTWRYGRQLARLRGPYERLAAHKTVFITAFTQQPGRVPSNIPFAIASDGPRVAADFGVEEGFAVAIIGPDGNLDYLTSRLLAGQRILDVIRNSFQEQERMRRR